ncbi:hypothetical protein Pla52o_42080 [Novipirellula galeiformis]|uniref:Oxaloacetate decarboxylase, gamma chain n=1 Tax=Novipirellula galeiformis TaxID=2528004 RepID=A0A5C6CCK2_9BACT|nr:hypothetical protein [Novipirellula galeiformis]TWU21174.1 hypothetical protein Pla52o_42080 [Novipirellula galeiformis]
MIIPFDTDTDSIIHHAQRLNSLMPSHFMLIIPQDLDHGISIAISGMLIVVFALLFISLFIAGLPRVLAIVAKVWPEVDTHHGKASSPSDSLASEDDAIFAAIGFVLHTEFQKQLQSESNS